VGGDWPHLSGTPAPAPIWQDTRGISRPSGHNRSRAAAFAAGSHGGGARSALLLGTQTVLRAIGRPPMRIGFDQGHPRPSLVAAIVGGDQTARRTVTIKLPAQVLPAAGRGGTDASALPAARPRLDDPGRRSTGEGEKDQTSKSEKRKKNRKKKKRKKNNIQKKRIKKKKEKDASRKSRPAS